MKHITVIAIAVLAVLMFFASCKKHDVTPPPVHPDSLTVIKNDLISSAWIQDSCLGGYCDTITFAANGKMTSTVTPEIDSYQIASFKTINLYSKTYSYLDVTDTFALINDSTLKIYCSVSTGVGPCLDVTYKKKKL